MVERLRAADVRAFALSLPGTVEGEHGNRPAFRVRNRLFAVIQPGERDVLLQIDPVERQALAAEESPGFEVIRNKRGDEVQEWITARLDLADGAQVRELLEDGWRRFASKRAVAAYDAGED